MPLADSAVSTFQSSRFRSFIQDRPLVAAGLGLAVGAVLAGILPATRTENRMLGEASDEMKHRARIAAKTEAEKLQATASRTIDAAKEGAAHVADSAARAAEEQGYPAGTLRAEHGRSAESRTLAEKMADAAGDGKPPR